MNENVLSPNPNPVLNRSTIWCCQKMSTGFVTTCSIPVGLVGTCVCLCARKHVRLSKKGLMRGYSKELRQNIFRKAKVRSIE